MNLYPNSERILSGKTNIVNTDIMHLAG